MNRTNLNPILVDDLSTMLAGSNDEFEFEIQLHNAYDPLCLK